MKRIPSRLTPHTVHVEPVLPADFGQPERFGPMQRIDAVQVVDRDLREVVSSGAIEVVSSARVGGNAGPGDYAFKAGDRVTLWKGEPRERVETVKSVEYGPQTDRVPPQQIATLS